MDFSEIFSFPSPNDSTRAHIQSTDLHSCQRYLNVCASLVNVLTDREIDIRSVHYKYRIERFLHSRSRTSQRFIRTYEQRYPELAIPKDQLFIYESNGNVRIDLSTPTTNKKVPPQSHKSTIISSKQQCVEEKLSSKNHEANLFKQFSEAKAKVKKPRRPKQLPCWTVAIYHLVPCEEFISSVLPPTKVNDSPFVPEIIPLPWIIKKVKTPPIICDLRILFNGAMNQTLIECDLRPLFYSSVSVENVYDLSPLFVEVDSELSPLRSEVSDKRVEPHYDDILDCTYLVFMRAIVILFAIVGILLFLLCYASLGEKIFIHPQVVRCFDDDLHTLKG